MPLFYALNGVISTPTEDTLLIIKGNQTLCFKLMGASVVKGYYDDTGGGNEGGNEGGNTEKVRTPKNLTIDALSDNTIKLSWERGEV